VGDISPCADTKVCARCKRNLPVAAFKLDPKMRCGRGSWCSDCHRAARRRSRIRHKEKYNDQRAKQPRVVEATCPTCGAKVEGPRKGGTPKRYCSDTCRWKAHQQVRPATCEHCREDYLAARVAQRYCSHDCHDAARVKPCIGCGAKVRREQRGERYCTAACKKRSMARRVLAAAMADNAPRRTWIAGWCRHCGEAFVFNQANATYCSRRCTTRAGNDVRKQRVRAARTEDVWRSKVYRRDRWCCQLCGDPVDRDAQVPHPLAPTLDHILPLSLGGEHSYGNVQLAHFICNSRKGATCEPQLAFAA
jgi:hypothetical protein